MNSGKIFLALMVTALSSGYALAEEVDGGGGKITYTGVVTSAPCSIKKEDVDKKVDLGDVTDTYINANIHSEPADSSITLENCSIRTFDDGSGDTISKVNVTFTSTSVVNGTQLLSNTFAGGAANVGVRLRDGDGNNITLGTAKELILNVDSSTQILPFQAWMEKIGSDNVTAGDVTATANYTLIYN